MKRFWLFFGLILLLWGGGTAVTALLSVGSPLLTIGSVVTLPDSTVSLPLTLSGSSLGAVDFELDLAMACLTFDPTDSNLNGVPDSVTFAVPDNVIVNVVYFPVEQRLRIALSGNTNPAEPLPTGDLVFIELETSCTPTSQPIEQLVSFSENNTFYDVHFMPVAGTFQAGLVTITNEPTPTFTATPSQTATPTLTPTPIATPTPVETALPISHNLFLALVRHQYPPVFVLRGQVVDAQTAVAVPNVPIYLESATGQLLATDVTNEEGLYAFENLLQGNYRVWPNQSGVTFAPMEQTIFLTNDTTLPTFTRLLPPTPTPTVTPTPAPTATPIACQSYILNGGFEGNEGWQLNQTAFPARYVTFPHWRGDRAMQVGMLHQADNQKTFSSVQQTIQIPAQVNQATLSFWLYTVSGETAVAHAPLPFDLNTVTEDKQLVILNPTSVTPQVLLAQRENNQAWAYYEFDVTAYAGQVFVLYLGVVNDGIGDVTGMVVDEVMVESCQ